MIKEKLGLLPNKLLVLSYCVAVVSVILSTPAYAYLDSGTASILLQSLLGGLAVAIASVSIFWHKVRTFLFGDKSGEQIEEQTEDQESD